MVVGYHQAAWPSKVELLLPVCDPRHIFSRYVVGWMVASRESKVLAERLIATLAAQRISADQLTCADRGSSMSSKPVALLLADLRCLQVASTPHTSSDNPLSEAQFKTQVPARLPKRFGVDRGGRCCDRFFGSCNHEHKHSGIGLHTPAGVRNRADQIRRHRACVLDTAGDHLERIRSQTTSHPRYRPSINPPPKRTSRLNKSPKIVSQKC